MWNLTVSGIKQTLSPALAGGFLTPEPPGKPYNILYIQALRVNSACGKLHVYIQGTLLPCVTSAGHWPFVREWNAPSSEDSHLCPPDMILGLPVSTDSTDPLRYFWLCDTIPHPTSTQTGSLTSLFLSKDSCLSHHRVHSPRTLALLICSKLSCLLLSWVLSTMRSILLPHLMNEKNLATESLRDLARVTQQLSGKAGI